VVSYTYDLAGRLTGISDTSAAIAAAVPPSGTSVQYATSLGYDAMNRPTAVTWSPAASAAAPTAGSVTFGHTYNKVNQRTGQTVTDNTWFNYPAATPGTVNYTANALNQYTAVGAVTPTYNGNGNLTSDGTFTFAYNAENRLVQASGAGNPTSYTYDAQGRRKTKTVNFVVTALVTDADNREVLEYDGPTGAIRRWYAYGLGSNDVLSQMNVAANTRATFLPDIQGSVIASVDSTSGAITKNGYLPYGKSASAGPFGYTGQRIDTEINGLYYYRARHYSPAWGRFLQTDPIGYGGGSNLYAYVNNDPLNNIDPMGLAAENPQTSYGYGYGANAQRAADNLNARNYGTAAYYELLHTAETALAIIPFVGAARTAGALAAENGTATYYRTMSQANYEALVATGKVPATGETFITESLAYAMTYRGVTVELTVRGGTAEALLAMGVRNVGLTSGVYGSLPLVQSGWWSSAAFFKLEGELVNIGLGRGSALNTFNSNIVNFNLVPRP
jgi:RHS repeat-associated protein